MKTFDKNSNTYTATTDAAFGASDEVPIFEPNIEWRDTAILLPNPKNARTHNRKQRRAIKASIRKLGFNNPILIDSYNMIIAGHGRIEAAKELGMEKVPVVVLSHLSDDELRAYMLADNQLATLAGWDDEILAVELKHLLEIDIDLEITGFEAPVVDKIIENQLMGSGSDRADKLPRVDDKQPVVSRLGDIWLAGKHRMGCGNARISDDVMLLMNGNLAAVYISDVPFNVNIDGNVCGSGATKHSEFIEASGELSREEFATFLWQSIESAKGATAQGSVHFIFMDWRSIDLLLGIGCDLYSEYLNLCVWNKTNAGMGSFYRSQHELVAVFRNGDASHQNNIQLGKFGRNRSNVWTYPGVNTFDADRRADLKLHPTVKPVALVADAIRDVSTRGDIVLDTFLGSGTTIIAAEETGRVGYGMELDSHYVDVAVRRWEEYSGEDVVHADLGLSFGEVAELRSDSGSADHSPNNSDAPEDSHD